VFITHGHEDHYGLAARLGDAGARIYLPENEYPDRQSNDGRAFYCAQLKEAGLGGAALKRLFRE